MTPLLGRIYVSSRGGHGYMMVMSKTPEHVTLSPLFWAKHVIQLTMRREQFDQYYQRYHSDGEELHPVVKARYDREKVRRWAMIG